MDSLCRVVLAVLSLWPGRAGASAPPLPPGAPRGESRAELDSAVLLTRGLLRETRQLAAQLKAKFPAEGDHSLDSLPTPGMSFGAMGALQLPSVLTRLRTDLLCYLWHVHWLRRAGGPALRSLDPELGALQVRLDRLLKRLQILMARFSLPKPPPEAPNPPLAPPGSAWGGSRQPTPCWGGYISPWTGP